MAAISEWSEDDRPREKMMNHGAQTLSDAELLAILIGSGTTKESAVDLMKRVLRDNNNSLRSIGRLSLEELCEYKGVGLAKAVRIKAACEIGLRREKENAQQSALLNSPQAIYNHLRPKIADLSVEYFYLVLLDARMHIIRSKLISMGGTKKVMIDLSVLFREALLGKAAFIVVAHNHPSGSENPSREDDELTRRISETAKTLGINFIDHIVMTNEHYYSYAQNGRIINPKD